jgi:hypothetical protein
MDRFDRKIAPFSFTAFLKCGMDAAVTLVAMCE